MKKLKQLNEFEKQEIKRALGPFLLSASLDAIRFIELHQKLEALNDPIKVSERIEEFDVNETTKDVMEYIKLDHDMISIANELEQYFGISA